MLSSGFKITFLKYFPLPVTIKYSPAKPGTEGFEVEDGPPSKEAKDINQWLVNYKNSQKKYQNSKSASKMIAVISPTIKYASKLIARKKPAIKYAINLLYMRGFRGFP